jgi:bifunctional non-homologous end joining protein LigD
MTRIGCIIRRSSQEFGGRCCFVFLSRRNAISDHRLVSVHGGGVLHDDLLLPPVFGDGRAVRSTSLLSAKLCQRVGPGWVHELKHDGYRLQIHVRDGRVRLFTMNGADWSKRYPRIVEEAARIKGSVVMDAEVVCLVKKGIPDFDMLHGRTADHLAVARAFDLLMHDGDDLRRQPLRERKLALGKLLICSRGGIQYVEHSEGHGEKLFEAVCDLGLEGIVSKRLTSVYRSGPSRTWIKVKNPKAPAATRAIDDIF